MNGQAAVAAGLRTQADWARKLGSPLYTALLSEAAADVEAGGACWRVLERQEDTASYMALALRFLGAMHRLVLEGKAPELAPYYPSAGGARPPEEAWPPFRATVEQNAAALGQLVIHPVQTNEVARSCGLLGGFLLIARETGLPLRLLELGASAGLNLRWDHYWYQAGRSAWGDPQSPIRFENAFAEGEPPFDCAPEIIERAGCDPNPLDPNQPETELTLASFVWPDQLARFHRLRAALAIARSVPARLDRGGAVEWLEPQLSAGAPGAATVVFHSIVMDYLPVEERNRVGELLHEAGGRAVAASPLAWLRMERGGEQTQVRLTLWPGGEERLLATAAFHGPPVRWLAVTGATDGVRRGGGIP
jgi:hypothetical protein